MIHTGTSIVAGLRLAFPDIIATILAGKSRGTITQKIIDQIMAGTSIGTWSGLTDVHNFLAQWTNISWHTTTLKVVNPINTGSSIQARIQTAIIGVVMATAAAKSCWTDTGESIHLIDTTTTCK